VQVFLSQQSLKQLLILGVLKVDAGQFQRDESGLGEVLYQKFERVIVNGDTAET
jgi:hypothetical protein